MRYLRDELARVVCNIRILLPNSKEEIGTSIFIAKNDESTVDGRYYRTIKSCGSWIVQPSGCNRAEL